ncbi:MAG: hypothetical protein HOO06_15375 [Bdellovibrionaceae bacterium]|nr:hypothetical protein [Pseudobdellovibrionaceae bacterium]
MRKLSTIIFFSIILLNSNISLASTTSCNHLIDPINITLTETYQAVKKTFPNLTITAQMSKMLKEMLPTAIIIEVEDSGMLFKAHVTANYSSASTEDLNIIINNLRTLIKDAKASQQKVSFNFNCMVKDNEYRELTFDNLSKLFTLK